MRERRTPLSATVVRHPGPAVPPARWEQQVQAAVQAVDQALDAEALARDAVAAALPGLRAGLRAHRDTSAPASVPGPEAFAAWRLALEQVAQRMATLRGLMEQPPRCAG